MATKSHDGGLDFSVVTSVPQETIDKWIAGIMGDFDLSRQQAEIAVLTHLKHPKMAKDKKGKIQLPAESTRVIDGCLNVIDAADLPNEEKPDDNTNDVYGSDPTTLDEREA